MIVSRANQTSGAAPKATPIGKRPGFGSSIYESGKQLSKTFGVYEDIRSYLPEERIQSEIKDIYQHPVKKSFEFQKTFFPGKFKKRIRTSTRKFYEEYRRPKRNNFYDSRTTEHSRSPGFRYLSSSR